MKIKIDVCSNCLSKDCDGVLYETIEAIYPVRGSNECRFIRFCKRERELVIINNKPFLKITVGHGDTNIYPVRMISK